MAAALFMLLPVLGLASEPSLPRGAAVPVPAPSQEALAFYRSGNWIWLFNQLWGMLVPAALLFSGVSARLRSLAVRIGRRWFGVVAVYVALFAVLTFVIGLPVAYFEDFVRPHAHGLSSQTLGKWAGDELKQLGVGLVLGVLFVWVPYLLLRRSPKRWWLYTALLVVPFLFLVLLVSPVWIDPLFNRFGPMRDKPLEAQILDLAARSGIEAGRVYEVEKSVDTKQVGAYVTGCLGTQRIVLWDTLLAKLGADEVLFVTGHELGHYVLGHVWKLILVISLLALGGLYAAHRLARALLARFRQRIGFDRLDDVASLPLLLLLMAVLGPLALPIFNAFSRHLEHEADRFAVELTRDNQAGAAAFVKLQAQNLSNPRPDLLVEIWRWDHPPIGERIDFLNSYRPWVSGEPGRYEHLFRAPAP